MTVQEAHTIISALKFRLNKRHYTFRPNGEYMVMENEIPDKGTYEIYQNEQGVCYLRTEPAIMVSDLLISVRLTNQQMGGYIDIQ